MPEFARRFGPGQGGPTQDWPRTSEGQFKEAQRSAGSNKPRRMVSTILTGGVRPPTGPSFAGAASIPDLSSGVPFATLGPGGRFSPPWVPGAIFWVSQSPTGVGEKEPSRVGRAPSSPGPPQAALNLGGAVDVVEEPGCLDYFENHPSGPAERQLRRGAALALGHNEEQSEQRPPRGGRLGAHVTRTRGCANSSVTGPSTRLDAAGYRATARNSHGTPSVTPIASTRPTISTTYCRAAW